MGKTQMRTKFGEIWVLNDTVTELDVLMSCLFNWGEFMCAGIRKCMSFILEEREWLNMAFTDVRSDSLL